MCEKDSGVYIVPNLSPEFQIRRKVETNYVLASFRIPMKYMDKEIFNMLFTSYIRPKLMCGSSHVKKHKELVEPEDGSKIGARITELSYRERLVIKFAHLG